MPKQLTRAQLVVQLEASHVSYQKLDAECARLREHAGQRRGRSIDRAAVIAHDSYASALVKARELAMRTGRSVRVG